MAKYRLAEIKTKQGTMYVLPEDISAVYIFGDTKSYAVIGGAQVEIKEELAKKIIELLKLAPTR